MPRIRQTAVRSHAGAARWTGKNFQTTTVSTVHVTIQDVGEFDLPAAFLRTFEKYKDNWLEVVLRDLFGAESEAASMSVENADPESEEPVHVTLSSRLWTRVRDTRVTFTLADLDSHATEDEEADDSKSERESESRDLSVPQIDTPETRFPLPQVVTAAKLGPDPSLWARRFFVCLLGLSEVEYQTVKQGKSDLGRIDQDDFLVLLEAGWERFKAVPLSLRLRDFLQVEDAHKVRNVNNIKNIKVKVEPVPAAQQPWNRWSGEFTIPRIFLMHLLGFTEQEYQAVKVGQRPDLVQVKGGRRVKFVFGPLGWSRASTRELKLSLEDLFRDSQTNFQLEKP
jgi:hypothetical protein